MEITKTMELFMQIQFNRKLSKFKLRTEKVIEFE